MTTKISSLIARYIAENTRLIIPNIGTLLRRKESGEIVFMEMLKKSDGTLNSIVASHLNLSDAKAGEVVEEYVGAIKRSLDADKKFIMDGVGVLLAGANGGVEFIFNPSSHSIAPEKPAVQPIVEEPKAESKIVEFVEEEEPTAEPIVAPAAEPIVAPTAEPIVAPTAEPAVEQKPIEPVVKPTPVVAEKPIAKESAKVVTEERESESASESIDTPASERKIFDVSDIAAKLRTRTKPSPRRNKRIKLDGITILAIVSGLIAICTLIWGMIPSNKPLDIETPIEIVEE